MRNGVLIINTLVISIALVLSGFIIKPYLEEASNQYLSQKRSIVVKGLAEKEAEWIQPAGNKQKMIPIPD